MAHLPSYNFLCNDHCLLAVPGHGHNTKAALWVLHQAAQNPPGTASDMAVRDRALEDWTALETAQRVATPTSGVAAASTTALDHNNLQQNTAGLPAVSSIFQFRHDKAALQYKKARLDLNYAEHDFRWRGITMKNTQTTMLPLSGRRSQGSPRQLRYTGRMRCNTAPVSVLRDEEVPYVEGYGRAEIIGNATGTPTQSVSYDGVNAGGYPVPSCHPFYEELIRLVTPTHSYFPPRTPRTHPNHILCGPLAAGPISIPSQHQTPSTPTPPPFYNPYPTWHKAIELFKACEMMESLKLFTTILSREETFAPHSHMHYNCGIIWSRLSDLDSAATAFEHATTLEPTLTIAWFCLGVCHYALHRLTLAMAAFDKALGQYNGTFQTIDYTPCGLNVQLQKTSIAFDRDLCVAAFGQYREVKIFEMGVLFEHVDDIKAELVAVQEMTPEKPRRRSSVWTGLKRRFSNQHGI